MKNFLCSNCKIVPAERLTLCNNCYRYKRRTGKDRTPEIIAIRKGQASKQTRILWFLEKIEEKVPLSGCWIWKGSFMRAGYGQFQYKYAFTAHRASWLFFKGEIPKGMDVCHHCDNRKCVNPSHLFLGTHQDNMDDRSKKDRQCRGERYPKAKLKDQDISDIRRDYRYGNGQLLADKYGIGKTMLHNIVKRKAWMHVKEADK